MNVKEVIADVVAVCGVALIGIGLWLVYVPAAFMGVGTILLLWAILVSRGG